MSEENIAPDVEDEMRGRFFEEVLRDLEARTEDWTLVIAPLGDGMGFRVEMHVGSTDQVFFAGASNASAMTAGSMAVSRGLARLEELLEDSADETADEG